MPRKVQGSSSSVQLEFPSPFSSLTKVLSSASPCQLYAVYVPYRSEVSQYLHSQPAHPENSLGSAPPAQPLPAEITHLPVRQRATSSKAVSDLYGVSVWVGAAQAGLQESRAGAELLVLCAVWAPKPALHQQRVLQGGVPHGKGLLALRSFQEQR